LISGQTIHRPGTRHIRNLGENWRQLKSISVNEYKIIPWLNINEPKISGAILYSLHSYWQSFSMLKNLVAEGKIKHEHFDVWQSLTNVDFNGIVFLLLGQS